MRTRPADQSDPGEEHALRTSATPTVSGSSRATHARVVPAADAARVAAVAQKREDLEGEKRAKLAAGVLGLDMYDMRCALEQAGLKYIE